MNTTVNARLIEALKFYADKNHLMIAAPDAWDTVSGEPENLLCDDAGTATVEDGSIARAALAEAEVLAALTDEHIDAGLDLILRAAGSALKHYTMQKSRDDMRAALRSVIGTDREGG